ncbi:DnaJ family domain-containing protein [Chitiniphilus shinanonensis]|uniref:DnaJ family domain-containing protein n=1 Tax=Chitiniphilus shinanonensis TaxID=553088 RepID=UPI00306296FE
MWWLNELAERRIAEARDAGELDNLPGSGRPLPAEDIDPLVPEHQRMAYRVLKNAGYLPPELQLHAEAVELALQLATAGEAAPALQQRLARINALLRHSGHAALAVPTDYAAQCLARLGRGPAH